MIGVRVRDNKTGKEWLLFIMPEDKARKYVDLQNSDRYVAKRKQLTGEDWTYFVA